MAKKVKKTEIDNLEGTVVQKVNIDKKSVMENSTDDTSSNVCAFTQTSTLDNESAPSIHTTYVEKNCEMKLFSDLNITELISYEQACALLCRRFEKNVQLDFNNNLKFKEYQHYYEMIFNELEKRVAEICRNNEKNI